MKNKTKRKNKQETSRDTPTDKMHARSKKQKLNIERNEERHKWNTQENQAIRILITNLSL